MLDMLPPLTAANEDRREIESGQGVFAGAASVPVAIGHRKTFEEESLAAAGQRQQGETLVFREYPTEWARLFVLLLPFYEFLLTLRIGLWYVRGRRQHFVWDT